MFLGRVHGSSDQAFVPNAFEHPRSHFHFQHEMLCDTLYLMPPFLRGELFDVLIVYKLSDHFLCPSLTI